MIAPIPIKKDKVRALRTEPIDSEVVTRILVATDGEPHSQVELDALLNLPLTGDAHILVMTVIPHLPVMSTTETAIEGAGMDVPIDLYTQVQEEAERVVAEAAKRLMPTGAKIETAALMGSPAGEIVKAAKEWNADLIILGCRQRRGLLAWFQGSVSRDVLRNAPCPVLIAPIACAKRRRRNVATSPRRRVRAWRFRDADFALSH